MIRLGSLSVRGEPAPWLADPPPLHAARFGADRSVVVLCDPQGGWLNQDYLAARFAAPALADGLMNSVDDAVFIEVSEACAARRGQWADEMPDSSACFSLGALVVEGARAQWFGVGSVGGALLRGDAVAWMAPTDMLCTRGLSLQMKFFGEPTQRHMPQRVELPGLRPGDQLFLWTLPISSAVTCEAGASPWWAGDPFEALWSMATPPFNERWLLRLPVVEQP